MIYESSYWKDDLLKRAQLLRKRHIQKRWSEKSLARIEQTIMLGFYSIRKLIEAKKLTDAIAFYRLTVISFPWKGYPVNKMNRVSIDILYDLEKSQSITKNIEFFCNQFIHSYVFVYSFDESNLLYGIYVNSDRERHKNLYLVEVDQIIHLFEVVGNDSPAVVQMTYNSEEQDYDIRSW